MFRIVTALVFVSTLGASNDMGRLKDAVASFSEIMEMKDRAIPQELLDKAECIVIVPGLKKGAFIVGAKYGRGFVSCRNQAGPGWSAPAGVRVEGGSVGFQIGGAETDVVMLVMNKRGSERLLSSKFTIGGDASVAAGPVGRTVAAQTDATMRAEILSWSRSRGAFIGVSLAGATLREDRDANRALYGSALRNKEIVFGTTQPIGDGTELVSTLNRFSSRR